ncbi:MAG: ATP-dependent Clp protease ATP-binding subunit [Bosea sp.]|uniref:AAA family ATPase n=1 Tax=Bosea sp. (in: a-proteobacteria) TaxID=1871050 RepID=UPI00238547A3|nr:ATP-dependent Clp protease ATP-binding subunit [Bosea sp. (in: a-proteobacteria)]MCP4733063.1 ATP-dependent Clp protease ATP-binding subunit [Bosea sp. (in: a-proteobacteria)]
MSTLDAPSPQERMTAEHLLPLAPGAPAWLRDVGQFLSVKPQFVLSGNIFDHYVLPHAGGVYIRTLTETLWSLLEINGFDALLVYDRFENFQVYPPFDAKIELVRGVTSLPFDGAGRAARSMQHVPDICRRLLAATTPPDGGPEPNIGVLIHYASRLTLNATQITEQESDLFGAMLKLSHQATPIVTPYGDQVYRPIFWAVDQVGDLPAWLLVGNENIRQQSIPMPTSNARAPVARFLAAGFDGFAATADDDQRSKLLATFVDQTEGMTILAMEKIAELARNKRPPTPFSDLADAVRAYKLGVVDSPWKADGADGEAGLLGKIRRAETEIRERVKGQDRAVVKAADILRSSVLGLSGAHTSASGQSGRPRGVLFLAGPTGTGKTELAKALSQLLFGDERACIRFDMSEFSAEHSEARLIGAPPGYVGHDAGGQLTKAVRERPFCVVLFDEIEKAHPRIMDKFLQILEDGRLTDGRGDTVYFSEAIIVFTSNLGISQEDVEFIGGRPFVRTTTVSPELPYREVEERVRTGIEKHFKEVLKRPELLNRLGDNIVVFDFIRADTAMQIFDIYVRNFKARFEKERKLKIEIADGVIEKLKELVMPELYINGQRAPGDTGLSQGGRGIFNLFESNFNKAVSRALLDIDDDPARKTITVTDIRVVDRHVSVVLA